MPTNHREDDEIAANEPELEIEIEPVLDDGAVDYAAERVADFEEDVEDIDLDSLVALEGPDFY